MAVVARGRAAPSGDEAADVGMSSKLLCKTFNELFSSSREAESVVMCGSLVPSPGQEVLPAHL